jgi:hypothetical protein
MCKKTQIVQNNIAVAGFQQIISLEYTRFCDGASIVRAFIKTLSAAYIKLYEYFNNNNYCYYKLQYQGDEEEVKPSEMSDNICLTIRRSIPEDSHLYSRRFENMKSHTIYSASFKTSMTHI